MNKRFYVYTAIDIYSRKAFAMYSERVNTHTNLRFVLRAQKNFGFQVNALKPTMGLNLADGLTTSSNIERLPLGIPG